MQTLRISATIQEVQIMTQDISQLLYIQVEDIDIGGRFRKDYGDLGQLIYSI